MAVEDNDTCIVTGLYPNEEKSGQKLFLQAVTGNNNLKSSDSAIMRYPSLRMHHLPDRRLVTRFTKNEITITHEGFNILTFSVFEPYSFEQAVATLTDLFKSPDHYLAKSIIVIGLHGIEPIDGLEREINYAQGKELAEKFSLLGYAECSVKEPEKAAALFDKTYHLYATQFDTYITRTIRRIGEIEFATNTFASASTDEYIKSRKQYLEEFRLKLLVEAYAMLCTINSFTEYQSKLLEVRQLFEAAKNELLSDPRFAPLKVTILDDRNSINEIIMPKIESLDDEIICDQSSTAKLMTTPGVGGFHASKATASTTNVSSALDNGNAKVMPRIESLDDIANVKIISVCGK